MVSYKAICSIGEADYEVRIATHPVNYGLGRQLCSIRLYFVLFGKYHKKPIHLNHEL